MFTSGLNASGLTALRVLQGNTSQLNASLLRLSTGDRIPRASFDPASLITSENYRTVLAALSAEVRVAERADRVIDTADAALGEANGMLAEAEALAIANANTAGLTDEERAANQMQIDSILASVDRIAGSTTFNGDTLLDGDSTVTVANESITILNASTSAIGETEIDGETYTLADVAAGGALNTVDGNIGDALDVIRQARTDLSTARGALGGFSSNTIASQLDTLNITIETTAAANSVIRDTDYAAETANLARLMVLNDASMAGLAIIAANRYLTLDLLGA
ncbi:MAG: flagellin [Planctomycetota bacterium]